ncbi:family 16 glycosylhydrolase [Belnapia rosea]|uniref:family 16 glycosylhydrolase n=1 Tax=Belnapia rosea TaxID=938405 RepID=UPI000891CE8F|nr:family 16 glycosylhydrolase [Belnapia rosea]SDB72395.1 Glycosyl hydrolases family 16 [Belnapia rosea]
MANFFETFSRGVGQLNHTWGKIDASVAGQVTLTGNSGMMQWPSSASAGNGYGHYEIVAALKGNQAGPAILLWPGNDKWPGTEMDLAEIHNGSVYGTAHHKTSTGGDGYRTVTYSGVDESKPHKYTLDWTPGKLVFGVDGRTYGTITKNVGKDFEHGGIDAVFGALNNNSHTSVTVYEMSYTDTWMW